MMKVSNLNKVLILIFIVALATIGYGWHKSKALTQLIGVEEASAKVEKFINENLLPANMKVTIKSIVPDGNLYKIVLEVKGEEYTSYMTNDGEKFFQAGINIDEETAKAQQAKAGADQTNKPDEKANVKLSKKDKPDVELFVMSHCPYGTQIEKGILPVLEALGSKINFTLKFCDYVMHGQKELNEQLTQYCIQKEDKGKLVSYLKCFLNSSDSGACLKSVKLNEAKINSCVKLADQQYSVTKKFNDKKSWPNDSFPPFDIYKADNTKYGIQGSPSLVINGVQVQAERDSASLLTMICSAFNKTPAECSKKLSSTPPSPGFGQGEASGSTTAADCAK
ncbi:MAG: hypothetical protein Q7T79_01125 [bacterium]|nr:hypothetical protein [bacterium]